MKKFIKNNKKIIRIIIILLVIILLVVVFRNIKNNDEVTEVIAIQKVEVMALGTQGSSGEPLNFLAQVVAADESTLTAETSGPITQVLVKEGDKVKKGQTLVRLKSSDQSISYNQAKVQLENQQLILKKLEKEYNGSGSSVQATLTQQQELQVKNAYQAFLNSDLQAYPEDNPERQDGGAPLVSGTYQSTQEGEYNIEVYSSGSDSGASIRLSGLESGTYPASTKFPTAIGTRGLFLQFPENFKKNSTWIISIPNKQSSKYITAKSTYEAAKAGKDLTLEQSAVSDEQLQQQRNAVRQQELNVTQAALTLAKTSIKAPFDGTIIDLDISEGAIINTFSSIGTIKTLGDLELKFSVSNRERLLINVGDKIFYNEKNIGEVSYVAASLDTGTFKNNIRAIISDATDLTEGDSIAISITPKETDSVSGESVISASIVIPLTAIQIIGNNPHVATIDDMNKVVLKPVKVGLLFGNQIEIKEGLGGNEIIIIDSRGLIEGESISY